MQKWLQKWQRENFGFWTPSTYWVLDWVWDKHDLDGFHMADAVHHRILKGMVDYLSLYTLDWKYLLKYAKDWSTRWLGYVNVSSFSDLVTTGEVFFIWMPGNLFLDYIIKYILSDLIFLFNHAIFAIEHGNAMVYAMIWYHQSIIWLYITWLTLKEYSNNSCNWSNIKLSKFSSEML